MCLLLLVRYRALCDYRNDCSCYLNLNHFLTIITMRLWHIVKKFEYDLNKQYDYQYHSIKFSSLPVHIFEKVNF